MEAALEHIRLRGGTWAILQVRADNAIARGLYERLGFEAITGSCEMRRPQPPETPLPVPEPLPLEPLPASAWHDVYDLAVLSLSPMAQWWQPPRPHRFRVTVDQRFGEWLNRVIGKERVWRLGLRERHRLKAAVIVRGVRWASTHRLEMWVHPACWGRWENSLVAQALNLLVGYPAREIVVQVHTEYVQLIETLRATGFREWRTLITMRRRIESAAD